MSRLGRADRGQTMVEFALLLPIFVLVLVGIFDLGRAVYAFNTINNAAREGGRLAIVDQTEGHIQDRAAQHAASVAVADADVIVDYRLATASGTAGSCDAFVGGDGVVGCLAVVQVPYEFNSVTPLIGQLIGTISMVGETRFRVEINCQEPSTPSCPIGD